MIDGIGKDDLLDVLESKLQVTSNMGLEGEDSSTMASVSKNRDRRMAFGTDYSDNRFWSLHFTL